MELPELIRQEEMPHDGAMLPVYRIWIGYLRYATYAMVAGSMDGS